MGFGNQLRALIKKNVILWYRNILASICEIFFPMLMVSVIVIVRQTVPIAYYPTQSYLTNTSSLPYYDDINIKANSTTLFAGSIKPDFPFASCISYQRFIFAFVGSSRFDTLIKQKLLNDCKLAHFLKLLVFSQTHYNFTSQTFNSEQDLESYVRNVNYENTNVDPSQRLPGICAGIVTVTTSNDQYEFKLRYEDDNYNKVGVPQRQEVPSEQNDVVNTLTK